MGLEKIVKKAIDVYKNNRIVNINSNILAAAAPSILAATGMSELLEYQGCSEGTIATAAAVTDWAVYIPVHVGLHYRSNKERFIDNDGYFQRKAFAKDVAHVYATQLPSIGLFYAMASPFHYYLMKSCELASGVANQISYWGTMVVTRLVHTLIGLKTGLFKKKPKAPE